MGRQNPVWGTAEEYIPYAGSDGTKLEVWSPLAKRVSGADFPAGELAVGTPTEAAHGTLLPTSILKAKHNQIILCSTYTKFTVSKITSSVTFVPLSCLFQGFLLDPARELLNILRTMSSAL